MADNLYCDELGCGKTADAFGFICEKKWKTCKTHSIALIRKKTTIYGIAAFQFAKTPADASIYDHRLEIMRKGMGNLTTVESACDSSWTEGQKQMQETCTAVHKAIEQCFQEMWHRGQSRYEEMKKDIGEMRTRLEKLVIDRSFELNPEDLAFCDGSVDKGPAFCVIVGDSRLQLAEMLMTDFHMLTYDISFEKQQSWAMMLHKFTINQEEIGRFDLAMRAAEYAKELGADISDYQAAAVRQGEAEAVRLRSLFTSTAKFQAEECLKAGLESSKASDFEKALIELQQGRDLLEGLDSPKLYLQLSVGLSEIHCQQGNWSDAVSICEPVFRRYADTAYHYELLQSLCYLVHAYYGLDQWEKGYETVREWVERLIADSPSSECVLLCIQATKLGLKDCYGEAQQLYELAFQLDPSVTYINTYCKRNLADMYKSLEMWEKAEETFLHACELFSAHFPKAFPYPMCVTNLGILYWDMKKYEQAEMQYLSAIQLFSTLFFHNKWHALCRYRLGELYIHLNRLEEAEPHLLLSISIYSSHFPHLQTHADCLRSLGFLYSKLQRKQAAEQRYLEAVQVYRVYFPETDCYANCLYDLGGLYEESGRWEDAVEMVEAAREVYERIGDKKGISDCDRALNRW